MDKLIAIDKLDIQNKIFTIRGEQVMLDSDLATLYGVETKRINEAVRNNIDKFPSDFYFELSKKEDELLRSKFSTFKENLKNRKYASKVFTEQGVYMLATVLKSKVATDVTISIIRTFSQMRKLLNDNILFTQQLKNLETQQLTYELKTDEKLEHIFKESHDRFMIIDEHEVYHLGASLKDLGKKWFAFSKFDEGAVEMLGRLK